MTYEAAALAIAKEALKPASGVVDALLGPKLLRIRGWATERELKGRIDEARLEAMFRTYLQRLLRRVSGVTTLVFPQQVLELPAIYEPLSLVERPVIGDVVLSVVRQNPALRISKKPVPELAITRPGKRTYIIDGAGMGKSTFSRHMLMSEIVNGDRIPLFLELRRIPTGTSLIDTLARDLDELHQLFDREVFLRLLSIGRFLLVLDGLDEVPTVDRSSICLQIEELSLKAEKSAIILTSRPEVALPVMTGARLLTFAPLTDHQARALVRRYDNVGSIDVGERLIARFSSLPEQFLRTPLLVALLYRSFGYNGVVSSNITSFYDELYDALYKGHDLTKAGFARPKDSGLDFDAFRRLVRGFAFLLVAQGKTILPNVTAALQLVDDARRLTSVHPSSSSAFLDDLLLAVPLLLKDGQEIRFVHKTIGEFFAAEHIAFSPGAAEIAGEMCKAVNAERFRVTISFLSDLNPALFKRVVAGPIAGLFLQHLPEIESLPIRTLSFLFGDCEVGVFPSDSSAALAEPAYGHNQFLLDLEHKVDAGYVGLLLIGVALHPLISTVLHLLAKKVAVTSEIIDDHVASMLPIGEWISLTDKRLHQKPLRTYIDRIASEIISFAAHTGKFDPETCFVLDDERARRLLEEIEEENNAQTLIRNLLRSE